MRLPKICQSFPGHLNVSCTYATAIPGGHLEPRGEQEVPKHPGGNPIALFLCLAKRLTRACPRG